MFPKKGDSFTCPVCKKIKKKKNGKQKFCSILCYRKHYKTFSKETRFPIFICKQCGHREELNFMPTKKKGLWTNYECSNCGVLANISENK